MTVICDFDGTITTRDVGHALCERFAPGALDRVDAEWFAGRLTFREAFRQACRELSCDHRELVTHALAVGEVRAGFSELVAACAELGVELIVASAGFDLYIEPILERSLGRRPPHVEYFMNRAQVLERGVDLEFPHHDARCDECGTCKGLRAIQARANGRTVIGVGDSYSDRCLAQQADHLFARSWLADTCRDEGIAHSPFEDFHPVIALVKQLSRDGNT